MVKKVKLLDNVKFFKVILQITCVFPLSPSKRQETLSPNQEYESTLDFRVRCDVSHSLKLIDIVRSQKYPSADFTAAQRLVRESLIYSRPQGMLYTKNELKIRDELTGMKPYNESQKKAIANACRGRVSLI